MSEKEAARQRYDGAGEVLRERERQVELGYDAKHDDQHRNSELVLAAICYASVSHMSDVGFSAMVKAMSLAEQKQRTHMVMTRWPFREMMTITNRQQCLTYAAAMLIAEKERRYRQDQRLGWVEGQVGLRITGVALHDPLTGVMFNLPTPSNHGKVQAFAAMHGYDPALMTQGFIASDGRFVDRLEARFIAAAAQQLVEKPSDSSQLYSEDLAVPRAA